MKYAALSLSLILLAGCQDTKIVTQYEYQDIIQSPPVGDLVECEQPFDQKPLTYGEAASRDAVWLTYFRLCACKIERNRTFYGYTNKNGACSKLDASAIQTLSSPPTTQTD
ncbi:hypothetical protein VCRA2119O147_130036 [Vibrio crassostreae]|jgi:hypothetical protein|uniref:Lipoprotein n=1 Tax=Vibrio crassostreae TaxID=246167 RepID=A0ABP1WVW7_9VIBR|nr:hypothetical protein [Vibrio crassostreae]TCL30414.1 hypothetical protein EDB52_101701 [Vibrio crassostreae]CAK1712229.1 hypothetical protein VCRA2113O218_110060 [Vibrio crassostreae]CAK1713358.1 hypothetical protein VCRA2112O192_110060 [Vibrio crassostreae]CAK1716968.1 hypothetical protein VCRA2113O224_110094 [Vibrio crassostreae]CAK1717498.1 hypothetical protein VCRA2113O200_110097 [Vibrio crassostreae]